MSIISKTWSAIVDMVERDFCRDDDIVRYNGEKGLYEALEELLESDACDCTQYTISMDEVFESPGLDAGYVVVAWVNPDGSLEQIDYPWYSR